MQAARLPCRPLQALLSFREVLAPRRGSAYPTTVFWSTPPLGASSRILVQRPKSTRVACPRTRAPSAAYEVARRATTSDPIPSFKRARRRDEDGSTTFTPRPRNDETTENLERELMWVAQKAPSLSTIRDILSILIGQREVRPTPLHYEALILGNCDPEHGSVDSVAKTLREMKDEGITIGASIYNAVLSVCRILPNSACEANTSRF